MISLGDLLVFVGAITVTVIYVAVLHHFISQSEQSDADHPPDREQPSTKR